MSDLEITSQVVGWLSLGVTTVGLGGLITQASAINAQLDPFHASRTPEYLGLWLHRQARFPWYRIAKPPPEGPRIEASIVVGFCSLNTVHIARIPLMRPTGKAGWSTILGMFNARPPPELLSPAAAAAAAKKDDDDGIDSAEKGGSSNSNPSSPPLRPGYNGGVDESFGGAWESLERRPLHRHQTLACTTISRVTLITMLAATNARPAFQYVDASGYRAGFASYCGQWYITWPIGQDAIVKFVRHDSLGDSEVFPRSFPQRIDRCGQMMCGVVISSSNSPSSSSSSSAADPPLKLAFCGRKSPGIYRLQHAPRGFENAHGARHLFNMMGGRAYEVDFLEARPTTIASVGSTTTTTEGEVGAAAAAVEQQEEEVVLSLPSTEKHGGVRMVVPAAEEGLLRRALDCLPWARLSWSVHRGLRDVLLAYARPRGADRRRAELAALLAATVADPSGAALLTSRGWDAEFVRSAMAQMASSAVLAGGGNSGDAVRVVAAVALEAARKMRAEEEEKGGKKGKKGGQAKATTSKATEGEKDDEEEEKEEEEDLAWLDDVTWWRRDPGDRRLDADGVIALTKVFVLEWSIEIDYQMYHDLPVSLYFG